MKNAFSIPHHERRYLHERYRVGILSFSLMAGSVGLVLGFIGFKAIEAFYRRFPNFWGRN